MSGFISSLLVEPIVRQARRLSHQTASSSAPENYEHEHTQQISFLSNNHDSEDVAAMPSNGYFGLGQASGYANPANESPISPNLRPFELANQVQETQRDQENEDALLSGQFRNEHRCDDNISENPAENSVTSVRDMDSRSGHPTEISTAAHDTSTVLRVRDSLVALETTFEMEEIAARSALPEDDGMGVLRRRIHAIRDLDIGSTEKARMIHNLMTEKYNASRIDLASHPHPIESSPGKLRISDHSKLETTHGNQSRFDEFSVTPESNINQSNPYNLTREDLEPTFSPKVEQDLCVGDGDDMETEEFEEVCLGCEHYKRNVKLQCYACKKWYTCRFCHDQVEDHHLNRRMTENMLCMLCGCAQPASQWCKECGEQTAQYYCNVCKLWDNDSKKNIYHCSDCGICRIGQGLGKDFFHCRTCSVCLPISIENTHRCIERSTQCDCPICGDYMFTSPETVVVMRCGHSIHHKCLSEYSKSSYRCPICTKTITNMESTFRNLDRAIDNQPMPGEFKDTKALICCNDCGAKSVVRYHWLGLRCDLCESYNTAQIRLLHGEVLDPLEQVDVTRPIPAPRPRSSSYGVDEGASSPTLERLQINSMPGTSSYSRLGTPLSADRNGQFASYSLTRDRAVSPVISNYFGLPPDRESEKSKSSSLFGDRLRRSSESDRSGELHFWGAKLKYQYGFLGEETESVDGTSETGSEESYGDESYLEEEETDDDYTDDDSDSDSIDIFGHQ